MDVECPVRQHKPRRLKSILPTSLFASLLLGCLLVLSAKALAQTSRPAHPRATAQKAPANEAEAELARRVNAAQIARKSGNAAAVGAANARVVALALREMAHMRLMQLAYPQAIELYGRSLDFEDVTDTHVDRAIAYLQANQYDKSLEESARALTQKPDDVRAQIVRGKTLMSKGDYAAAGEVLTRVVDAGSATDMETLYSLAVCYLQSKASPEKVQAVFRKITAMVGDSGSLHVLFGRAYRDADDLPSAIREFQRAIELDPRTPHAHYFLGLATLAIHEWKATPEATAEFQKELEFYPHDYLANYMLGFSASAEHRYDSSDKYLEAAAKENPESPDPWIYLGSNANARGDKTHAEQMYRKAIKLTGTDEARSNYQIRRVYIDLGRILVSSGRREEGERYLAKARELQNKIFHESQQNMAEKLRGGVGAAAVVMPLSSATETQAAPLVSTDVDPFARVDSAVVERANLTAAQRSAAEQQENQLRSVLALAFNDMATSEAVSGEYMAALGHYQEAEKWDAKTPGLARNLGLSAYKSKNYPQAIRGFTRALQENPGDNPVRAMLGMAYFGSEKYADAVKTFKPLGVRGMQDATVGYAWAASLTRVQQLNEAAEVLGEFAKGDRSNETRMLIGQLWIEIADYGKAVETFDALAQSDPQMLKTHYFAGQADIRWGHWADAEKEFKAELKLNPADIEAKYNLGFVCLQESRVDDAARLFQEVLQAYPEHARAQYNLGKILLDRGELAQAVNHLEIATRLSPGSDYMHYQLQVAYRKQSRIAEADRELALYKEIKEKKRGSSSGVMGSAQ